MSDCVRRDCRDKKGSGEASQEACVVVQVGWQWASCPCLVNVNGWHPGMGMNGWLAGLPWARGQRWREFRLILKAAPIGFAG